MINNNGLNQSYGIIFKPETEYYTDTELLNNTAIGFRKSKLSSKILKHS